jgi:hypothetical protein
MPNPYSHQNTLNSTIFAPGCQLLQLRHPSSNDRNQAPGMGMEYASKPMKSASLPNFMQRGSGLKVVPARHFVELTGELLPNIP